MILSNISFKNINNQIEQITKEIATGEKTLSSKELNKSMILKTEQFQENEILEQINNFKINSEQADSAMSSIKLEIERFKVLRIKNETLTKIEMKSIIDNIKNLVSERNGFKESSVLVDQGIYKTLNISKEQITKNGTIFEDLNKIAELPSEDDLTKIDEIYDHLNLEHVKIGIFNKNLDIKSEEATKNIFNIKKNRVFEETDLTEALINLNSLKIQYQAMAITINKTSEMSLVKFLN